MNGNRLRTRRGRAGGLVAAWLIVWPAAPLAQPGDPGPSGLAFERLDRLYFERLWSPPAGGTPAWPLDWNLVSVHLPASLPAGGGGASRGGDQAPAVRDFPLPGRANGILRQLLDRSHPRITSQYWALYVDGQRTDLWFFAPVPERTEGKLLSPYEVERLRATENGGLVVETCGSMFRPQGAWWWQGRDFHFVFDGERLRFERVVTRFHASRGYDLGEIPPLDVYAERERPDGGLEVRSLDAVTGKAQVACRFTDPHDEGPVTCAGLERAVRCLTNRPEAVRRDRPAGTPSFVERGGQPIGKS